MAQRQGAVGKLQTLPGQKEVQSLPSVVGIVKGRLPRVAIN